MVLYVEVQEHNIMKRYTSSCWLLSSISKVMFPLSISITITHTEPSIFEVSLHFSIFDYPTLILLPIISIMGWGGCIGIMNASPYTMTPSDVSSYQMKSWSFPDKLLPGSVNKFYVEYDEGIFVTESDTAAKVVFELDNPSKTKFEFHSEHLGGQGRNIFVQPSGLQQAGPGNTDNRIDLGFVHDSCVGFYISGEEGSLHANNPPKDWMHSTLNVIGDKTLRDISLPGAHDAGMGPDFKAGTFGSDTANTKTQALTIGGQLDQGARWFDIRPVIGDGGKWLTGHYSGGPHSLGGNGEVSYHLHQYQIITMS